jgi:hypothetical protein
MTRIKKKPEKRTWQQTLAEFFRYAFFVLYVLALGGMIAGTRWISRLQEESDQKMDQQIQQRLHEIKKRRAEKTQEAQRQTEAAARPETEIMPLPSPDGVENAAA